VPRTLIIGDVHGCADELVDLLHLVGVQPGDRVVFVGDLVGRGPYPKLVVEMARSLDALAVRGNHEQRLLEWRAEPSPGRLPRSLRSLAEDPTQRLGSASWAWLAALPLWLELPEHGARVVHAGVVPGRPMAEQRPRDLVEMRCLSPNGEAEAQRGGTLWGLGYEGPPHVIFGHNANEDPQLHLWATGIDTGCVYGGSLTAMVLGGGQPVPSLAERASCLWSVAARRRYAPIV
jgi:hypothetical protein